MKKLFIPLMGVLGLVCCAGPGAKAQQQEYNQHISKAFTLPKGGVLAMYNINGPLDVEGYSGDQVLIEVDEKLSAEDTASLEAGKREFQLALEQSNDSILVYIAKPYDSRPHSCNNCCCCNREDRPDYDFILSFKVKVPFSTNLDISTINKGDVTVKDVSGSLKVNNVNGKITIGNAEGITRAHTINGNLTVSYVKAPAGNSDFYTLNGKLTVTFPSDLSADLQFKSMNGQFYTDFPDVTELPVQVVQNKNQSGSGTVYKLDIDKRVRIGNGGKLFHFETLNGNIYIKNGSKATI
jgi:hypothetical protein